MASFSYYSLKFKKHPIESWIVVTGDITNDGDRNYTTAVFRVKLFIGPEVAGSGIVKIAGFHAKKTKPFEAMIENAHHALIPKITKCEVLFETSF